MSLSQNLPVYPPWHAQPMYINLLSVLAVSPSSGSTHWPPCWQVHILMVGLQLTLAPLSSVATKVMLNYKGRKTSYVDSAPLSICRGYFFRSNWTVILQRKFNWKIYLLWWRYGPMKWQHVSSLVPRGSCRFVYHVKSNGALVLSCYIQLNCFAKCGIYHIWSVYYLRREVVCKYSKKIEICLAWDVQVTILQVLDYKKSFLKSEYSDYRHIV